MSERVLRDDHLSMPPREGTGVRNGMPEPRGYRWRSTAADEAARRQAEADAAFVAECRRQARERIEAEGVPELDVPFSSPVVLDAPLPRPEGAPRPAFCLTCRHHYRTRMPHCDCACHADLPAGAGQATPPVTTAPCSGEVHAPKGDSRPAGRCEFCGYMRGSRGHHVTCGGT